jgi:hypothetical protein
MVATKLPVAQMQTIGINEDLVVAVVMAIVIRRTTPGTERLAVLTVHFSKLNTLIKVIGGAVTIQNFLKYTVGIEEAIQEVRDDQTVLVAEVGTVFITDVLGAVPLVAKRIGSILQHINKILKIKDYLTLLVHLVMTANVVVS